MAGGVTALVAGKASAATPSALEFQNDVEANKSGVQLIYEARDLDIDAKPRGDGPTRFAFQKLSTADTKARASESAKRIETEVFPLEKKQYWLAATASLRRQVGTLRFDLNNLAEINGKDPKTTNAAFIKALDTYDLALRKKDGAAAAKAGPVVLAEVQKLL